MKVNDKYDILTLNRCKNGSINHASKYENSRIMKEAFDALSSKE